MPQRRRPRSSRRSGPALTLKILPSADRFEVWLFDRTTPLRRAASIHRALVIDARRHGQDLLDEAVCGLLRKLEAGRAA